LSDKPRILLIPNVAWWIIGEMGKQIIARFGDKYDFYFVPEGLMERRPELLGALLPAVDAVHCLNESSIDLFRSYKPGSVPPIATWIHHVTTWSPQHQLAAERSSAITVCTRGWKDYLISKHSVQVPISVVPHGVDSQFFRKRKVKPERFGIPRARFVLGFIGAKGSDSDRGRKGTDVLLDVLRRAAKELPNLHVILGGPGWESELAGLHELGISASATGYIRKAELPDLYSALDVYLVTSRIEGGPCTVFEAMACQTAVVSTRVGAVPDLIVDGVNGYSADVDDVASLVAAVVAVGRSAAKRAEIGTNARDTVVRLPWAAVLSPLEPLYDELIRARSTGAARTPGPSWMAEPQELFHTSCAADALSTVINRLRKKSVTPVEATQLLFEMLDRKSIPDVLKGLALLRGITYKNDVSLSSAAESDR
jgi:glycosyltransferase involved in cell wall biosynthesis